MPRCVLWPYFLQPSIHSIHSSISRRDAPHHTHAGAKKGKRDGATGGIPPEVHDALIESMKEVLGKATLGPGDHNRANMDLAMHHMMMNKPDLYQKMILGNMEYDVSTQHTSALHRTCWHVHECMGHACTKACARTREGVLIADMHASRCEWVLLAIMQPTVSMQHAAGLGVASTTVKVPRVPGCPQAFRIQLHRTVCYLASATSHCPPSVSVPMPHRLPAARHMPARIAQPTATTSMATTAQPLSRHSRCRVTTSTAHALSPSSATATQPTNTQHVDCHATPPPPSLCRRKQCRQRQRPGVHQPAGRPPGGKGCGRACGA